MLLEAYLSELRTCAAAAAERLDGVAARLRGPIRADPAPSLPPLADAGVGFEAALEELVTRIVPGSLAMGAPGYLGLLNTSPLPAAIAGELFVSALNNNAGAAHQAPAAVALETTLVRGMLALFGWEDASGQLVPAGSFANLHGVLLARHARLPEWDARGPRSLARAPRVYTSAASHFSVARAARIAGFGADHVIAIPVTGRGAMDAGALAAAVARDRQRHLPTAVVATMGTTGTGAIDPFAAIADVCAAHGLWLHVDACYGGGLLLLPELAHHARAIGRADSIAIDAHKQWYMPIGCGAVLTRHPDVEREAFAPGDVSYLPASDTDEPDAFRRGIATSRRATAIAMWLALRTCGWDGIRQRVRRNVTLVRRLERALAGAGFEVLPDGVLSTACARWPGSDALQEAIAARAVATGTTWFATTRHDGRTWLRFALVNCTADEATIDAVAATVTRAARESVAAPEAVSGWGLSGPASGT